MSATIKRGDIVRIKPEWQDPGDERFIWRALEDEDGERVKICATNTGLTFPPNQIVNVSMLEMAQENARLLAQHTSGPWRVIENAHIDAIQVMAPSDGDRVCTVTSRSESAANGRLIAAAPELLAALIGLLEQADLGEVDAETAPLVEAARAAIAKATGGAQ